MSLIQQETRSSTSQPCRSLNMTRLTTSGLDLSPRQLDSRPNDIITHSSFPTHHNSLIPVETHIPQWVRHHQKLRKKLPNSQPQAQHGNIPRARPSLRLKQRHTLHHPQRTDQLSTLLLLPLNSATKACLSQTPISTSQAQANNACLKAVESDTQDPTLNNPGLLARLQTLGPVQPNPTFSNSSTFNQRPPLHNPANPHIRKQNSSLPSHSQQASHDPSLSAAFIPSASAPSQSIFPHSQQTQHQNQRQNPAVSLLTARYRLAEEAEKEFGNIGKSGGQGRRFLDVVTIRKVLDMRDEGVPSGEIERRLELRKGVVGQLGRRGVVGVPS
jgi:hypothetical protein